MHCYLFIIVLFFTSASPLFAGKSSSPLSLSPSSLDSEETKKSPFSVARSKLSLHDCNSVHMNLAKALANYVQDSLQFTDDKTLTKELELLESLPEEERTESLLLINTKREALSRLAISPSRLLEFLCLVSRKERTLDFVEGVFSLFEDSLSQEFLNELHILSQSSGKTSTLLKAQNFFQPGRKMAKNMMNLITVCNRLPSDDEFLSTLGMFRRVQRSHILAVMASSKEKLTHNTPLETLIVLKKFDPKDRTEETIQNLLTVLNHQVGAQKKPLTSATRLLNCLKKHKKESWLRVLNRLVVQTQQL